MGRVSSYRAGYSSSSRQQKHKANLKSNRLQSKLFRQQVQNQQEQAPELQRIGTNKLNSTYNSNLTLAQQLMLLVTIMGVLVPVVIAYQDNSDPSSTSSKDNKDLKAAERFTKKLTYLTLNREEAKSIVDSHLGDLIYFSSNLRSPELQGKATTNLQESLYKKTRYDEKLYHLSEHEQLQKCEHIVNAILETIKKIPSSKEHIERSINDPRFELRCTAKDRFPKRDFGGRTTPMMGLLDVKSSLADDEDIWQTIHHEFRHVDFSLLHHYGKCRTAVSEMALPFFPTTPEMIVKFTKALDQGDERINKFSSLWDRDRKGKILSLGDKRKLDKYIEASKGYFGARWEEKNITKSKYEELENLLAQSKGKGDKPITFMTDFGFEVELLKLNVKGTKQSPEYYAYVKSDNQIKNILELPSYVQQKLVSQLYNSSSLLQPDKLLDEREAYTMESLSLNAMQVFYPEAYQMTQEFIRTCSKEKPLTHRSYYRVNDEL